MNKELFKQFFVIAYMASKSERLPHRKNETVEIQADRYAEVCWIKFCQIWPVKEHDPFWHNKLMKKIADNPPTPGEKKD